MWKTVYPCSVDWFLNKNYVSYGGGLFPPPPPHGGPVTKKITFLFAASLTHRTACSNTVMLSDGDSFCVNVVLDSVSIASTVLAQSLATPPPL